MRWLDSIREALGRPARGMDEQHVARWRAWRDLPEADLAKTHRTTRYVVVDVEASGLNLSEDRLISIGAVAVENGWISPADAFEVVLRQTQVSSSENILAHGIGAEAQRHGLAPADALLSFLEFVGKDPLVAYRSFFSQAMIGRAAEDALGFSPQQTWLDLAWILPDLYGGAADEGLVLDQWLARCEIPCPHRHNAVCDSYAVAQLLQIALHRATARGKGLAEDLVWIEKNRRWLRQT